MIGGRAVLLKYLLAEFGRIEYGPALSDLAGAVGGRGYHRVNPWQTSRIVHPLAVSMQRTPQVSYRCALWCELDQKEVIGTV